MSLSKMQVNSVNAHNSLQQQKLLVLAAIGLFYSVSIAYAVQWMMAQGFSVTDDFFPRWYASRMLLTTGRSLYDWANSVELSRMGNWPLVHQLGYYYPAYLLIFTAPLSLIPFAVARVLWTVFGLWCLWLGMVLLARWLNSGLGINRLTLLLVLTTVSVPVLQHTLNAQFNTLGVLALALSYRALRQEKYLWAGLWAGGLLFKPQTIAVPLLVWLIWSGLKAERRRFWLGLAATGLVFWAVAEVLEPGWVVHFWQALDTYEPVQAVVDRLWNPYQLVSLALVAFTAWLAVRFRHVPAGSPVFTALLIWSLCLNSLIVPLIGMLHMVFIGPLLILLVSTVAIQYPAWSRWAWWGGLLLLLAGLAAFVTPLLLAGLSSPHINSAETVYKGVMPVLLAAAALLLMFKKADDESQIEII